MTVKDFLKEDKKLYERENKLLAELHKIHDKRDDGSWLLVNLLGLVDKNSNIELIEYEP